MVVKRKIDNFTNRVHTKKNVDYITQLAGLFKEEENLIEMHIVVE